MKYTQEQQARHETVIKFVEKELNPHVQAWEKAEQFPAHEAYLVPAIAGDMVGCLGVRHALR